MKPDQTGYLSIEHPPGQGQADFRAFMYYNDRGEAQTGYALTITQQLHGMFISCA